jgi:L-ascorbate metabolism protein UlaG (beta-lactamase superfamily)
MRPIPATTRANFAPLFAENLDENGYFNPWSHPPLPGLRGVLRWKMQANPHRARGYRPTAVPLARSPLAAFDSLSRHDTRVLWIGHASFLVDMGGTRFVIDPIFGPAAVVTRRVTEAAVGPEQLGAVHAVLVTHGHHDHLDPRSLRAIARTRPGEVLFIVPKGLGKALPRECRPYVELDWWQGVRVLDKTVYAVPAQHWHQRGPFDRNQSGWCGFVIEGSQRVFHSGDTGYFEGFRAVREVFGEIDAACLPLGAYEPSWFMSTQHMGPSDTLRAFDDLGAGTLVGMHWGAYDLSDEPVGAGPVALAELISTQARDPARFAVLAPGGSLGLSGEVGKSACEILQRHAL